VTIEYVNNFIGPKRVLFYIKLFTIFTSSEKKKRIVSN